MALVSDLINEAFLSIGTIQPGETITNAMQSDAFMRLNQMLQSWSTEGATVFFEGATSFQLVSGITAYTLGSGGSFNLGQRPQKVTAWRGIGAQTTTGGAPMSLAEFGAAVAEADEGLGIQSAIPKFVGADTSYPLLNVRVWPPPSFSPGQLELAYWLPMTSFFTVNDVVSLPPGYEHAIYSNLAVILYPLYPRQGGIPPELAAQAQNAKASIVQMNTHNSAQAAQQ